MNAPVIRFEHTPAVPAGFHEFANLFPMLQGDALDGLREDIRQNGVREPIVFLNGEILDGRNRYMCARDLGVEYPRVEFNGNDPLSFVISHNLHRRHLSESQRASVAAKLANMRKGERADYRADRSANLPICEADEAPVTVSKAAELLNVSERSVKSARKVQEEAPELVPAVDSGAISVSLAAQVAELPAEDRKAVSEAPVEHAREVAREAVKRAHVANNSGNNEWYTPPAFIEAARDVMGGIDLDPATSEIANRNVQAETFYTADDDGLSKDWPACRIWMNPPYAQPLIGQFCAKMAEAVKAGAECIVLVNNGTETAWFQTLADVSAAVCFPKSRVRFIDPDGNPSGAPLQGQAVIYCGPNRSRFSKRFGEFGLVLSHE